MRSGADPGPKAARPDERSHSSVSATLKQALRLVVERFRKDRIGMTAGSLTFTTLISLVPLLSVMLAAFTAFPLFGTFQTAIEKFFLQNLVPEGIARPVLGALTQFASKASRIGVVGLIGLVGTALALMLTIDRTLNTLWGVKRPRPIAQRLLVYWALMTVGPVLMGGSLTLTTYVISASSGWIQAPSWGLQMILQVLQFCVVAASVSALFHFVPHTPVRWRDAWVGGVLVAVGFEGAKKLLTWYLAAIPTYSSIYGAFATLPILLLWIYVVWILLLTGALVAALLPELSRPSNAVLEGPGARFACAVGLLSSLQAARQAGQQGLTAEALVGAGQAPVSEVERLLSLLAEFGWVGRLDESPPIRHVLLADLAATPARPLIDATLVSPSEVTQPFREQVRLDSLMLVDLLA